MPGGAFRGHGTVNVRFAFESLLDRMGKQLGLDPLAVRRANLLGATSDLASSAFCPPAKNTSIRKPVSANLFALAMGSPYPLRGTSSPYKERNSPGDWSIRSTVGRNERRVKSILGPISAGSGRDAGHGANACQARPLGKRASRPLRIRRRRVAKRL